MGKQAAFRLCCLMLTLGLLLSLALGASAAPEHPADRSVPAGQSAEEPSLNIAFGNLSYSSEIYVMYAVGYENVPNPKEIKMLFWDEYQTDGYLKGSETRCVSATRREEIDGTLYRIFYSEGLAAKQLVDTLYCRACVTVNGVDYYSQVLKFSPLRYIKIILDGESYSEADKTLAAELRSYGAAAQTRFDYKTDDMASDPHHWITLHDAVMEDGFDYGLCLEGREITLTAVFAEGDGVKRWEDSEGNVLGTEQSLKLRPQRDMDIRVILNSNPDYCDHVFGEWIPETAPSCTEPGAVAHYECSLCKHAFDEAHALIEDPSIAPLGHDWVDVEGQAASCIPGWKPYQSCSRCDAVQGYEEIPANGNHSYVTSTVAPNGAARGYKDHVCSVCGASYQSDFDYSLYSGVDFAQRGKFPLPHYFASDCYTLEASVKLPTGVTGRGGVIMGSYDNASEGFNLEIYNGGRPRLYFTVVQDGKKTNYDYVFSTDIRSSKVLGVALTIEQGKACLYVDGVLKETKTLDDFEIPKPKRMLALGGDNRTGNTQPFQGIIYSASVFRDIRTEEELRADLILADANDPACICSYNLMDGSELTGDPLPDSVLDYARVSTVEELEYHAGHGTKRIEVVNDIVIDRTIYAISELRIYADSDCSLIRDPDFLGDMIVIGENDAGRNLILDNIICSLELGGGQGTLTVDGNKENVNGEVFGSLVYINYSGSLKLHDGAALINNRKLRNARTLGLQQYYRNMVGGAAIVNINGTVEMDGGLIEGNETNFNNPSGGDVDSEDHLRSCYGGAVFSSSNFVMTGGVIRGNSGYYGGAVANFLSCTVLGGVIEENYTSHAGGAIYVYNADGLLLSIGDPEGGNDDAEAVIFRGNYTTQSSGGAIYSGAKCCVKIYGGATFDGNRTPGSGGAVYIGSLGDVGANTVFRNNQAGTGGAVAIAATADNVRATSVSGASFLNNKASYGGAIAVTGGKTVITDCVATGNVANTHGGAYYVNRMAGDVGATVEISGGSVTQNAAHSEAGGLFIDLNCTVSVSGTQFTGNQSTGNGGAVSTHGAKKLTLDNVSFSENSTGTNDSSTPVSGNGGALYASYRTVTDNSDPQNPVQTRVESSVTVRNCSFGQNSSDGTGGAAMGIAYDKTATVLTVQDTSFDSNSALQHGGAVMLSNCVGKFDSVNFNGNSTNANGGAVYCNSAAQFSGSGNRFTGNHSENSNYGGGAIYLTKSTATLSNTEFVNNSAKVNGGAIAAYTTSTVKLTDTVATGNSAGSMGGFLLSYNSAVTLDVSTGGRNVLGSLSDESLGNSAKSGGVFYADVGSKLTVSDADLGHNSATGSGGAIYLNGAEAEFTRCAVSHSVGGKTGGDSYGGAMFAGYGSSAKVTDSSFTDNSSTSWGGAIYVRHKDASGSAAAVGSTVEISNTAFSGNSSAMGGAVYIREHCSFTGEQLSFTENSATDKGGAIMADKNSILDLTTVNLVKNSTGTTGGAIYVNTGAKLSLKGQSLVDQNTSVGIGGAIYSNSAVCEISNTTISNNATTGSEAWYGGAIYTNGSSVLTLDSCTLSGNTANVGTGGAVCARGNGSMTAQSCSFTGNSAKGGGGAIHVFGITASLSDCVFTDNSTPATGGAIMSGKEDDNKTFLTVSGGTISGNSAKGGAAVYVKNGTRLDLIGTTISGNNTGGTGGTVYAEANATLNLSGVSLSSNVSGASGGAIYAKENAVLTLTDCTVSANKGTHGGGMIAYGANVTLQGGAFTGNEGTSSGSQGGAIYLRKGASDERGSVTVNGTAFRSNTGKLGGAIYVNSGTDLVTTNAVFDSNESDSGGAIYCCGSSSLTLTDCSFIGNSATGTGGAVYSYLDGGHVDLTDCLLENNYAKGNGGAIYHSAGTVMSWTRVTARNNSSDGKGDVVYVTNGSGKRTDFTVYSATFDQPEGDPVNVGNTNAYVLVYVKQLTDLRHDPVDPSLLFKGDFASHVTYNTEG